MTDRQLAARWLMTREGLDWAALRFSNAGPMFSFKPAAPEPAINDWHRCVWSWNRKPRWHSMSCVCPACLDADLDMDWNR